MIKGSHDGDDPLCSSFEPLSQEDSEKSPAPDSNTKAAKWFRAVLDSFSNDQLHKACCHSKLYRNLERGPEAIDCLSAAFLLHRIDLWTDSDRDHIMGNYCQIYASLLVIKKMAAVGMIYAPFLVPILRSPFKFSPSTHCNAD